MNYIKLSIPSTPEGIDDLCARLVALGTESFQIEDERDVLAEFKYWDMADESMLEYYKNICRVIVYIPEDEQEMFLLLKEHFPESARENVKEEDWAENWKQYYKPIFIGEKLVIHPSWEPLADYGRRAVFLNNPGMSFGTGLHASTRLCLEELAEQNLADKRVLDIGCGSGILAVSALLLGARQAVAIDIDNLAADVARENAKNNGVTLSAYTGDFLTDVGLREKVGGGFDVICSNIVADVIIGLSNLITEFLTEGGIWISSGIIDTRAGDVAEALLANGFSIIKENRENGWVAVVCGHSSNS